MLCRSAVVASVVLMFAVSLAPAAELLPLRVLETFAELNGKSRQDVGDWYRGVNGYLCADADGKQLVDVDAHALGIANNAPDFFQQAVGLWDDPDRGVRARKLLRRYAPDGPAGEVLDWRKWLEQNQPYLFFSDMGGYRWLVDPLAKRRGIPTAQLRGPARATLPAWKAD